MGNREAALALAAGGLAIFPCSADKRPVRGVFWRRESTDDVQRIERWAAAHPEAMPAIDLAKMDLVVIDADRHGGPDGVEAWEALAAGRAEAAPFVDTPSGGRHVYFRQPPGDHRFGNSRGALPPGIDVRGAGGYVIGPGAELPDGRRYVLHGNILNAPTLPDWLAEVLAGKEMQGRAVGSAGSDGKPATDAGLRSDAGDTLQGPTREPGPVAPTLQTSERRLSAYVEAGVEAELAKVRGAGKGGRNNLLNEAAFALGQMAGAGWLSEADAAGWLEGAAHDCGLVKDDGLRQVRATIRSGLGKGRLKPREPLPEEHRTVDGAAVARALIERDGVLADAETGEIVEDRPTHASVVAPQVPGLVGAIAQWITDTARRPQPVLSLGAALAVVGTAIGRDISGPTLSGTHLYVIGLAPTGAGKDHPLQQCATLLRAAGMGQHVGPSEFISMPAVIRFLMRSPLSLCAQDEFGAFLRRVNSRKASSFEGGVLKILRTAWGSSFKTMMTPEWAGREAEQIVAPAISLFGASTPEEFYGALEGLDKDNGVLNRFTIFASNVRTPERAPLADPLTVPDSIRDGLARLYTRAGTLAASLRNAANLDVVPQSMAWGMQAEELYETLSEEMFARGDADPTEDTYLARTAEMAVRIATIIAAGRGSEVVEIDDMAMGRNIALASAEMMIAGAREHMADTETQAQSNRLLRIIKRHGGRMKHRDLMRSLNGSLKKREVNDLIDNLIDAEEISKHEVTPDGGGTKSIMYRLVR